MWKKLFSDYAAFNCKAVNEEMNLTGMTAVVPMTMEGRINKIAQLFSPKSNQSVWDHAEVDPHSWTEMAARCVSDETTTHRPRKFKKKTSFVAALSGNNCQNKIKSVLKCNPRMDFGF